MEKAVERGFDWAGLPVIATVARLLCRELTLQNEYLRLENRILKEKVSGRIRFTDEERRSLMEAALTLGRSLLKEVVTIVRPETILAWQRRLERQKWDYSQRRRRGPGRPRTPDEIETLVCRLARENRWGSTGIQGCPSTGNRTATLPIGLTRCVLSPLRDRLARAWGRTGDSQEIPDVPVRGPWSRVDITPPAGMP